MGVSPSFLNVVARKSLGDGPIAPRAIPWRGLMSCALTVVMAGFWAGPALAGQYHIAPGPNTTVDLDGSDFLVAAPEGQNYLPPNAIGNNYGQHPGAFGTGWPPPDSYFIGVFADQLDLNMPDGNLYLWETTGSGLSGDAGPHVQLGFWDWGSMTFTDRGTVETAHYFSTQFVSPTNGYIINSSVIPLNDFNLASDPINAVRISYNSGGHNQVTAVASNAVIPEPSTAALFGLGLSGWTWWAWSRRTSRRKS
jgi:hypothetical protein